MLRRHHIGAKVARTGGIDHVPLSEAVVVAVTGGRLGFGTCERSFQGQAEWLARPS
jgi:hypothetical protein